MLQIGTQMIIPTKKDEERFEAVHANVKVAAKEVVRKLRYARMF